MYFSVVISYWHYHDILRDLEKELVFAMVWPPENTKEQLNSWLVYKYSEIIFS